MVSALKVGRNTQLLAVTRRISNPSQNSGSVAVLSLRNSLLIDATWTRVPATDSERITGNRKLFRARSLSASRLRGDRPRSPASLFLDSARRLQPHPEGPAAQA